MTGNQLKIEIRKTGLTQQEAAEKLNVTRQTLANWFNLDSLDANILHNVKENLGIHTSENIDTPHINYIEIIQSQQETISTLSKTIASHAETIKTLTEK